MTSWTKWKADSRSADSPYVDWSLLINAFAPWVDGYSFQIAAEPVLDLTALRSELATAQGVPTDGCPTTNCFPVPKRNNNAGFCDYLKGTDGVNWLPEWRNLPTLEPDDIVVGIIDVDIGLGHQSLRHSNGASRILAAWQQGALWRDQPYLPFGQEVSKSDINQQLLRCSRNNLQGPLDQEAFDQAMQTVDLSRPEGAKALAKRYAHGSHVLGLAAGADPELQASFAERVKLLVVNLPPAVAYGEGGGFLDNYLIYGMHWLVETYNQIVAASGHKDANPFAINISFGKQAGPKEDLSALGRAYRVLSDREGAAKTRPASVFLPSGNDNLSQCNALIDLAKSPGNGQPLGNSVQEILWRVLPDDETSNFVEIWSEFLVCPGQEAPFMIDVVPPEGEEGEFSIARSGEVCDLKKGFGRIYCDILQSGDGNSQNVRIQICLAPDKLHANGKPGARPGLWRIRLKNNCPFDLPIRVAVQTDQATLPGRSLARRSYFEANEYVQFDPFGQPADTYSYKLGESVSYDDASALKRRGTINSYASIDFFMISGFRASDGEPAPYASTALGDKDVLSKISAAFPSDTGTAHFGVLSSGASDGSVLAMRGTSFACASATRLVVENWLAGQVDQSVDSFLATRAAFCEANDYKDLPKTPGDKIGQGRISFESPLLQVPRL